MVSTELWVKPGRIKDGLYSNISTVEQSLNVTPSSLATCCGSVSSSQNSNMELTLAARRVQVQIELLFILF